MSGYLAKNGGLRVGQPIGEGSEGKPGQTDFDRLNRFGEATRGAKIGEGRR